MFWPAVRRTPRSTVSIDHLISFTIMMVAISSDCLYERRDYLREVMTDIANDRASIDFLASGIEFELLIHAFRCVERMIPINDLDYQSLALSHFESIELTFPQLCKLLYNPGNGYGSELTTIILCTEEIQNRTHSCFKRYLIISKNLMRGI